MATLARTRKHKLIDFLIPRGTGSILEWLGSRVVAAFFIMAIGGLVASATGVVAYLIYSGIITHSLASALASACLSVGNCSDFSALLSGMAAGVMILAVIAMVIVTSLAKPKIEDLRADEMSLATLLLNWYCLSEKSRQMLLKLLESSEADVSEGVVHLLSDEHIAMQEVMRDGG